MSYNTRRSGFGPGVNAIGQRRPQGNFVHGGQLNPKHQQRNDGFHNQQQYQGQGQQQPRQNQPPQQQKQNMNQQQQKQPQQNHQQQNQTQQSQPQQQQQNQAQQQQQNQPQQQQNQPQQQQQNQLQQQQQNQAQQQLRPNLQENAQALVNQIQNEAKVQPIEEQKPAVETLNAPNSGSAEQPTKDKPFWIKKPAVRLPRAERVRRRNMRLRKVLQPKNALMVLNELVGNTSYTVTDSKTGYNQDIFNAALAVEGSTFNGVGKSKVSAKTAAAEAAIKAIIVKRLRNPAPVPAPSADANQEEDEKMEEEQQQNEDLSWSHIASFAIHKLFASWDEDEGGHLVESFTALNSSNMEGTSTPRSTSLTSLQSVEQRPAKKLPENAAHLNPSMLLNQMYPHAKYEEVSRTGNPPNVQFVIACTVDGQTFTGTGPNKKAARKQAAFEACKTLLKIEYPPEVFDEKTEPMQVESNMPF